MSLSPAMIKTMMEASDEDLIERIGGAHPESPVFETGRAIFVAREIRLTRELAKTTQRALYAAVISSTAAVILAVVALVSILD